MTPSYFVRTRPTKYGGAKNIFLGSSMTKMHHKKDQIFTVLLSRDPAKNVTAQYWAGPPRAGTSLRTYLVFQ